jgi:hypothetical protein
MLKVPRGHFTASVALESGSIFLIFSSGKIRAIGERRPPRADGLLDRGLGVMTGRN